MKLNPTELYEKYNNLLWYILSTKFHGYKKSWNDMYNDGYILLHKAYNNYKSGNKSFHYYAYIYITNGLYWQYIGKYKKLRKYNLKYQFYLRSEKSMPDNFTHDIEYKLFIEDILKNENDLIKLYIKESLSGKCDNQINKDLGKSLNYCNKVIRNRIKLKYGKQFKRLHQ